MADPLPHELVVYRDDWPDDQDERVYHRIAEFEPGWFPKPHKIRTLCGVKGLQGIMSYAQVKQRIGLRPCRRCFRGTADEEEANDAKMG